MQPHLRTLAGALALAALLPSTALAQNIATDVASGAFAPATVPITIGSAQGPVAIIKSQQQARDAGAYSVLPPHMLVNWDFTQEMLLLAVDARTSGGGGVSISVEKRSMFGGFVPQIEWLDVKVTRSVPAPGSPGITVATRPFALVKLAKTNALIIPRVVDVSPSPPAPLTFTDLTRVLVTQPASSFVPTPHQNTETIQILANGQVTISTMTNNPAALPPPPLVGTATAAELQKLSRAVGSARLNQIPIDLGTGLPQFTLRVLGLAGGDQKIQGVRGQEGQYKARLDAIHASVDAIRDRLRGVNPPTGLGFVDISRRTTTAPASSFVPQPHEDHEDLQVFASGVVKFSRWSTPGATGIPPVTGLATRNELRALSRAIIAANFNQIPRDLGNANPLYTFRVIGIAGGDRKIQGTRGQEGQYKARLDAVHAALDAIRNRLDNTTPPPPPAGLGFTSVEHRTTASPLFNPPPSFPTIPGPTNPILPGPMPPMPPMMSSTVSTEVKADGAVTINRWSTPGPAPQPPVTGTATQEELKAVAKAVRLARFHEIPQDLGGFSHDTFSFRVIGTPQGDRKISGASGSQGQYRDRLRAVEDALTAIRRRIEAGPPNGGTFDNISLSTTETLAGPNRTKVISIGQSGNVTVSQIQPGGPNFQPARGQASAADMAELRQLVKDARVADIPSQLNVMLPMHLLSKPFTLSVSSVQQQNDNKISGEYGYYGQYDSRLRPLIAKVEAIANKVTNPNPPAAFDLVSRTQNFPLTRKTESLLIDSDGNATLRLAPRAPMLEPAPRTVTAKLTDAEMDALSEAVRNGNLASVPGNLPTPIHIVAGNTFHLKVSAPVSSAEGDIKGEIGFYGVHATKLTPVMDALDAITNRLKVQAPTKLFFEIGQATQVPTEVTAGEELVIEVKGIRPSTARLTEVETTLKSLETMPPKWELTLNAVGRHSFTTGDAAITRPFTRTVRVRIPAGDGEKTVKVVFNTEFLNGSARFERTVDITPKADEARGIVESRRIGQNGRVAVWLVDGTKRTRVLPTSFARTLRKFEGHEVKVSGKSIGSDRIRANTLVSPVRQDIVGTVSVNNGEVTIADSSWGWPPIMPGPVPMPPVLPFDPMGPFPSDTSIMPPMNRYTAVGPGAKVAAKADGLRVTADAWVFENNRRPWRPTKAYVVGIRATVLEDSDLTRRGNTVNSVRKNQQVLVTRLNRSGTQGVVKPSSGRTGYMPLSKLELGDRIFHILPATTPAAGNNPGLSGTLGTATNGDGN